jgi:prepilin-type N-terminal cleavage/methylation domain-containing protein
MHSLLSHSHERSRGFTFVEAIAALAVIAVLAGIIFAVAASSGRATIRITRLGRENVRILTIDRVIREAAARIRPPYWVVLELGGTDGDWALPYLDGLRLEELRLRLDEDVLFVDAGEAQTQISNVAACQVELSSGEETAPTLRVELEFAGGRATTVEARLGSWWL